MTGVKISSVGVLVFGLLFFVQPSLGAYKGHKVSIQDWPNAIRIENCSGLILNETTILTAGHCLDNFDSEAKIYQGNAFKATARVASVHYHPKFNKKNSNTSDQYDIGIVKLRSKLSLSIEPISLKPLKKNEILAHAGYYYMIGHGLTSSSLPKAGQLNKYKLRGVQLVATPQAELPWDSDEVLLKGTDGNPCPGDSGSPVWIEDETGYHLVGVVASITNPNCHLDHVRAMVHMLSRSYDWLLSHL